MDDWLIDWLCERGFLNGGGGGGVWWWLVVVVVGQLSCPSQSLDIALPSTVNKRIVIHVSTFIDCEYKNKRKSQWKRQLPVVVVSPGTRINSSSGCKLQFPWKWKNGKFCKRFEKKRRNTQGIRHRIHNFRTSETRRASGNSTKYNTLCNRIDQMWFGTRHWLVV